MDDATRAIIKQQKELFSKQVKVKEKDRNKILNALNLTEKTLISLHGSIHVLDKLLENDPDDIVKKTKQIQEKAVKPSLPQAIENS